MKNSLVQILFLGFLFCTLAFAEGIQVKFDIKTPLSEKKKLTIPKSGLSAYVNQSDWATVKEWREDYSLWIQDYRRIVNGDIIKIEVTLEIRGPSNFSRGDFWEREHVKATFDLSKTKDISTVEDREMYRIIEEQIKNSKHITSLGGEELSKIIRAFGQSLERSPAPDEVLEGMIVGAHLMTVLEKMYAKIQQRK